MYFTSPKYAKDLEEVAKSKNISINFLHNLIEVKPESKEAIFDILDKKGVSLRKEIFQVKINRWSVLCTRVSQGKISIKSPVFICFVKIV